MSRFGILNHFVLSGIIFDKSVLSNHVIHDVDNFSVHEPIVPQLCHEIKILGVSKRVHTPHVSWPKASEFDLRITLKWPKHIATLQVVYASHFFLRVYISLYSGSKILEHHPPTLFYVIT